MNGGEDVQKWQSACFVLPEHPGGSIIYYYYYINIWVTRRFWQYKTSRLPFLNVFPFIHHSHMGEAMQHSSRGHLL
jgi:hypothetical protein